jgi:hypothetical protein
MKTNILIAIKNLIENDLYSIEKYKAMHYKIRINNMGGALEDLIKDALCNSFKLENNKKIERQNEYFSYLGNQNNPPDLIIKNGDAFEIKKIEGNESNIALNSSFPKDKLYSDSNMITNACKNCEEGWVEKDICYAIGCIEKSKQSKKIKSLWFVYGDCYCAKPEAYIRIKNKITNSIQDLGIELSDTKEIAKIKKVDPLEITELRVRGMWGIQHPSKVFEYITIKGNKPYLKVLMLKKKFNSFDENSKNELSKKCKINEVKIKNPNNPANLLEAVLIEYEFNT